MNGIGQCWLGLSSGNEYGAWRGPHLSEVQICNSVFILLISGSVSECLFVD